MARSVSCTAKGEFAAWGEAGDVVRLHGEWVEDPRYGRQFHAEGLLPDVPEDAGAEGLARWLERQSGIGHVTARQVAAAIGDGGIEAVAGDQDALARCLAVVPSRFHEPLRAAAARARDDRARARVLWLGRSTACWNTAPPRASAAAPRSRWKAGCSSWTRPP